MLKYTMVNIMKKYTARVGSFSWLHTPAVARTFADIIELAGKNAEGASELLGLATSIQTPAFYMNELSFGTAAQDAFPLLMKNCRTNGMLNICVYLLEAVGAAYRAV